MNRDVTSIHSSYYSARRTALYIYRIYNNINGKSYIGQTIQTVKHRWSSHSYNAKKGKISNKFYNALRKYGLDSFSVETIEKIADINIIDEREIFWIDYFNTFKAGYNSSLGGKVPRGIVVSEERKQRQRQAMLGKTHKPETIQKMKKSKSEEWKQSMRKSKPQGFGEKIRQLKLGKGRSEFSEETKKNMSISAKKRCERDGYTIKSL